ncbi:MAG: hypothetical protein IT308_11180 [Anaerolineaceae bacterium]|nr:hypothetical protein [Anaerolineaceae bacterium]
MSDQSLWIRWAQFLHRWNLEDSAALLLEAAGPLNFIAAQVLYAGEPLLGGMMQPGEWQAAAKMLEDRAASRSFVALLRGKERQ